MTLRERVKSLCKDNNVSMNRLETDCGFAKGYISKLDKSTPNSDKLQKIADYFGVSLDYLVRGESIDTGYYLNEETARAAQEIFESKELRLLFDAARDADPEDLKMLHSMLLALKRKERSTDAD